MNLYARKDTVFDIGFRLSPRLEQRLRAEGIATVGQFLDVPAAFWATAYDIDENLGEEISALRSRLLSAEQTMDAVKESNAPYDSPQEPRETLVVPLPFTLSDSFLRCMKDNAIATVGDFLERSDVFWGTQVAVGGKTLHEIFSLVDYFRCQRNVTPGALLHPSLYSSRPRSPLPSQSEVSGRNLPRQWQDLFYELSFDYNLEAKKVLRDLKEIISCSSSHRNPVTFLGDLYCRDSYRRALKHLIMARLWGKFDGLSRASLLNVLPSHLRETGIAEELISELEEEDWVTEQEPAADAPEDGPRFTRKHLTSVDFLKYLKKKARMLPAEEKEKRIRGIEIVEAYFQGTEPQPPAGTEEQSGRSPQVTSRPIRPLHPRLLAKRLFAKHPPLREDRYTELFDKYNFSENSFCAIFKEPLSTFRYLSLVSVSFEEKRPLNPDLLRKDELFPTDRLDSLETYFAQKFIQFKGEGDENPIFIPKNRQAILLHILKTECQAPKRYEDIVAAYNTFCMDRKLDKSFPPLSKGQENSYRNQFLKSDLHVLASAGGTFRYYDIIAHTNSNLTRLLTTIDLPRYDNQEISARKVFLPFEDMIKQQYDIQNENELHNLLKKLFELARHQPRSRAADETGENAGPEGDSDSPSDAREKRKFARYLHRVLDMRLESYAKCKISFGRNPTIKLGRGSQKEQILAILKEHPDISSSDFGELYEERYGVQPQTAIAALSKIRKEQEQTSGKD